MSLDIAAGACICSLFFARCLNIKLSLSVIAVLSVCVWLIYTVDHLSDAKKIKNTASTERHHFHQKHYNILRFSVFVLIVLSAAAVYLLPSEILYAGALLIGCVGIYFMMMIYLPKPFSYMKEFSAALIYTAGVCLPAMSLYKSVLPVSFIYIIFRFFLIVLANLLSFSVADFQIDSIEKHSSLAVIIGEKNIFILLKIILLIFFVSFTAEYWYLKTLFTLPENVMLCGMMLPFAAVSIFPRLIKNTGLFRAVGDSVFLFPVCMLILY